MPWTHLIFEAYCLYSSSKQEYIKVYEVKTSDKKGDNSVTVKEPGTTIKNPLYIKDAKRPKWCIKQYKNKTDKELNELCPQPQCQETNCPYLAMIHVCEEDYIMMCAGWEKTIKTHKK